MIWVLMLIWGCFCRAEDLRLISRGRSGALATYKAYSDVAMMHFTIPNDVIFASLVFEASEEDLSIFGCSTRNVSLRLKQGAPPAINPDSAPFPDEFKQIPRPQLYTRDFQTNRNQTYVNITAPEPGIYYAALFLSYEDPRYQKISQQGLTQSCRAYVEASIYIRKIPKPTIVTDQQLVDVVGYSNESRYFIFTPPEDGAIIDIKTIAPITIRVGVRKPPTKDVFVLERYWNNSQSNLQVVFPTLAYTKYYISFDFYKENNNISELNFILHYFSTNSNSTLIHKIDSLTEKQPYKEFVLARETSAESFAYSYKLDAELGSNMAVPINVTSQEFVVLKFNLRTSFDIGGTLQYILAFKPRVQQRNGQITLEGEPKDYLLVGCLQKNQISVPVWPKYCTSINTSMEAPLVLNETVTNATVLVPYPESGTWFASFKLFCGTCQHCACPQYCQDKYQQCTIQCQLNYSNNCFEECGNTVLDSSGCEGCDCDGPCTKNSSNLCESSVVFDVSSRPCYYGDCGKQGRCGIVISEGVAYSTCMCDNNYRGFDCSDGSMATPYYLVLIEFLLLILSNVFFLPAAYVAYKRHYHLEALAFGSVFLSSSFYHACDAGENLLSFCIFRLAALQFADFFSAVLAIWLTLLAIADLRQLHLSLLQMTGAMVVAFCVTLNRYAFWIFALPACTGLLVIAVSWYFKYLKYRAKFVRRDYLRFKLPLGGAVVAVGLIIYGLLQTQDNYKYLHSLWHVTMAAGVFFVLPTRGTFTRHQSSTVSIEES